jgi:hypothetical protein
MSTSDYGAAALKRDLPKVDGGWDLVGRARAVTSFELFLGLL